MLHCNSGGTPPSLCVFTQCCAKARHTEAQGACRADKYACPQLDRLAREFLRCNFEKVVQFDGQPPNRVGLLSLSQTALRDILNDDNLELSSEVQYAHAD